MKQNIRALIYPDGDGYVVEIPDVKAVTQGDTIEDALANAKEAIALALDGENPAEFGLAPDPSLIVTIELGPLSHAV
ncbi:MAG: type II toxin-antitoxin system HicB family antitoxin [Phycisphaerales bacterium]|nr:type II toxin-antitoxin system HicB family antitoxin [Phycisphaerales bacterium]